MSAPTTSPVTAWQLEAIYLAEHPEEIAASFVRDARRKKREHRAYCLEQGFDVNAPTAYGYWADAVLEAESDADILALPPRYDFHWGRATVPGYVEELAAVTARYEAWRAALAVVVDAEDEFEQAVGTDAITAAALARDDAHAVLNAAEAAHGADEGWEGRFDDALMVQELEEHLGITNPDVWAEFIGYFGREPNGQVEREIAADPAKFDRWAELVGTAAQPKISAADTSEHEAAVAVEMARIRARTEAERRIAAESYDGLGGLVSWHDLSNRAATVFLIPDLLGVGEVALLVGKRNLGKSMFAASLGFSVATGIDFLGRPATQGRVLFVLGEGSSKFVKRLDAWAIANGMEPEAIRAVSAVYEGGNLSNDTSLADLRQVASDFKPALIILDTYSSLSGVADEDKAAINAELINRIKSLEPSASKLILHHPTKSTEDTDAPIARGSGTITANVDTVISLFRDRRHSVQGMSGEVWLAASTEEDHQGKQRDGSRVTITGLHIVPEGGSAVLEQHSGEALSASDKWVIAHLPVGEIVTVPDLVKSLGQSKNTIRKHLNLSPLVSETTPAVGGPTSYLRTA